MKISNARRRYRRSMPEVATVKKDNQPEQQFFGEAMHEPFFKPAANAAQQNMVQCKEEKKEDKKLQRSADKKEEEKKVQKKEDKKEEEKKVQKKEGAAVAANTSAVTSGYVSSINGKGNTMDAKAMSFYENRMGADFSNVKIHTGKEAAESAEEINAKAYTVGNDIVFNEGQYNTNSDEGKKLMAHELAHVMQNNAGENENVQRQTSTPVPATATVDATTQIATFAINSVNVVVEPDQTLRRGTAVSFHGQRYTVNSSGALTASYLVPRITPTYTGTGTNKRVSSVSISFTLYIKTFFGTGSTAADTSAYGRGTTAADVAAGNTSLGFHEGSHGQDYQDYVTNNPLPQITLAVPATMSAYAAAIRLFNSEMRTYSTALSDYSHTNTDMVGTPQP